MGWKEREEDWGVRLEKEKERDGEKEWEEKRNGRRKGMGGEGDELRCKEVRSMYKVGRV